MQPEQVGGQTLKGLTPQSGTQPGEKVSGIIIFEIPQSAQSPKSAQRNRKLWRNKREAY